MSNRSSARAKQDSTNSPYILVETAEIGFSPVQQKLWPLRVTDIDNLRQQFTAYQNEHGSAFNHSFPITVRLASEQEKLERRVNYICIDGHRRLAAAREFGILQVPVVIDPEASPLNDVINLKRVVEGDAGYSQVDRARLLKEMIDQGVPQKTLEQEYPAENLRRMLGYLHAPDDLKVIVEHDESQFTRVARVMSAVFVKPEGELTLRPPASMTKLDAERLVRYVLLQRQEDLNSEEATVYARQLRDDLLAGDIEFDAEGHIATSYPWERLGLKPGEMKDEQIILEQANAAIERLHREGDCPFTKDRHFNEALRLCSKISWPFSDKLIPTELTIGMSTNET